jgi:hypothetical protein
MPTKMTPHITKTTDDDRGGKENPFLFSLARNDFGSISHHTSREAP